MGLTLGVTCSMLLETVISAPLPWCCLPGYTLRSPPCMGFMFVWVHTGEGLLPSWYAGVDYTFMEEK